MKTRISGKTKTIGLIGSPVSHSRSPSMQNGVFQALGLDYAYIAFDVGVAEAEAAIAAIRTLKLRGCNVTSPLKAAVCPYLDHLSTAAKLAGAVNVIVNDDGILTGHITDGEGFMLSLNHSGVEFVGKKMTLIGAGGAATAVAIQAAQEGMEAISIFNRRDSFFSNGEKLAAALRAHFGCAARVFDLDDHELLRREIASSQILANGTTIGMEATQDLSVIPDPSYFHPELTVTDMIYVPKETKLLQMAKEACLRTVSGLGMQLFQAVPAFKLWTGQDMPIEIAREILFEKQN